MQKEIVFDEGRYQKMAWKAVLAIALFAIVYLSLVLFSGVIMFTLGYLGVMLIVVKPSMPTLILGGAMIILGILIFSILIKFVFKQHTTDRSGLIEVTRYQEPQLHVMIADVARAAGTSLPKRVYFSADVNACVFYDTTFWSMFFPIRKNLVIGLGLVQTVSRLELKAILAHEFGHFSQKSMRLGSFVYNVNRIIHNILFENGGLGEFVQQASQSFAAFAIAVKIADAFLDVYQKILRWVYGVVNLSHLALSREMEFHADKVAAGITGAEPLINALQRLHLSQLAYDSTLNFYERRIPDCLASENIFPQVKISLDHIAAEDSLEFHNGLPLVSMKFLAKFDRSKLVFNNQWESHPSTKDRIAALESLESQKGEADTALATALFEKLEDWQITFTRKIFAKATYPRPVTKLTDASFAAEIKKESYAKAHDPIYHGYYDRKLPLEFDVKAATQAPPPSHSTTEDLFNPERVEWLYDFFAMTHDLEVLLQIEKPEVNIKTFDYDGQRYKKKHCAELIKRVTATVEELTAKSKQHDIEIYCHAMRLARLRGMDVELESIYERFFSDMRRHHEMVKVYQTLQEYMTFMHQQTPVEEIQRKLKGFAKRETPYRNMWNALLKDETFQQDFPDHARKDIELYLSLTEAYFGQTAYNEPAVNRLFRSMEHFNFLQIKHGHRIYRELVAFQAQILRSEVKAS